jgi:tripartite-type tricarboxylate transporter receptor subunit TctC
LRWWFCRCGNAAYPDKPIQYIIPFAPGGESDVAARLQQQTFKIKFNQDLIVVNKAGAGGRSPGRS